MLFLSFRKFLVDDSKSSDLPDLTKWISFCIEVVALKTHSRKSSSLTSRPQRHKSFLCWYSPAQWDGQRVRLRAVVAVSRDMNGKKLRRSCASWQCRGLSSIDSIWIPNNGIPPTEILAWVVRARVCMYICVCVLVWGKLGQRSRMIRIHSTGIVISPIHIDRGIHIQFPVCPFVRLWKFIPPTRSLRRSRSTLVVQCPLRTSHFSEKDLQYCLKTWQY